mmetsp:Transcript_93569/g.260526  ORF Transcript_93569/g.260526 Transcript_93569/m.260526 type:complete len:245 (+) Transcript_93569:675-1409(+)
MSSAMLATRVTCECALAASSSSWRCLLCTCSTGLPTPPCGKCCALISARPSTPAAAFGLYAATTAKWRLLVRASMKPGVSAASLHDAYCTRAMSQSSPGRPNVPVTPAESVYSAQSYAGTPSALHAAPSAARTVMLPESGVSLRVWKLLMRTLATPPEAFSICSASHTAPWRSASVPVRWAPWPVYCATTSRTRPSMAAAPSSTALCGALACGWPSMAAAGGRGARSRCAGARSCELCGKRQGS